MEEGTVRLRVEFDDHLLTESQKSEGFVRCWLLVRSDFTTVSDVAAHILRTFALDGTCPDGIILSMDDFVLPLFESTGIFKNSDKVRVSKKLDKKKKLLEIGGEACHIQNSDIVEKRPILLCDELLTVQDSQEDIRLFIAIPCKNKTIENAYAEEERTTNMPTEEINLKRKRKQSDELQNSKKKKSKLHRLKQTNTTANLKENIHPEQHKSLTLEEACITSSGEEKFSKLITSHSDDYKDWSTTKGKRKKKLKLYNSKKTIITADQEENLHAEQQKSLALDEALNLSNGNEIFDKTTSQNDDQNDCSIATQERSEHVDNSHKIPPELHTGDTKKLPSRSARRKKAKRQWRRQAEQKVEEVQVQILTNDEQNTSSDYEAVDETADREEEIIPVIVRPGHIRFESLDDQEHKNTHSNGPGETLKWNGTISKKKGQKWGREKTIGWNDDQYTGRTSSDNLITDKEQHANDQTNFESLFPLTRLPKEGDMLVYRLVELSSSWCPEISPFRVGKVSSYDPISENIVMVLVPEYPILKKDKDAEESPLQADSALYNEDGSLEIKYTSLLDVRLFKEQYPDSLQNEKSDVGRSNNWAVETNSKQSATPLSDAGPSTGWEQIELALDEKKSQLQNSEVASMPKKQSHESTAPWSYRALRRSALGPTLALLRNNGNDAGPVGENASAEDFNTK
ncbi:coilin-like isoform X1 [Zingiber officinale]|uniref:coilin-like isoform X1 n=1 Tax=Zingiber officinale TaxID=94328 RepID=UPI001C4CBAFD|nr:coilin-like isoform X1 [Zingiber officinale]